LTPTEAYSGWGRM